MRAWHEASTSPGSAPGVGKATVALGLVELLSRQVARIGVFRPLVGGPGDGPDPRPAHRRATAIGSAPTTAYGVTYAEAAALVADGRREELVARIVERYREVERRCASPWW